MLRKFVTFGAFGKHNLTVRLHLKDATATTNQRRFDTQLITNNGGQTVRLGFVVSLGAVSDRNLHE